MRSTDSSLPRGWYVVLFWVVYNLSNEEIGHNQKGTTLEALGGQNLTARAPPPPLAGSLPGAGSSREPGALGVMFRTRLHAWTCMCIHYIHTDIHTYTHIRAYVRTYMHTHIHTNIHTYSCIYIHIGYTYTERDTACVSVYVYTCINT